MKQLMNYNKVLGRLAFVNVEGLARETAEIYFKHSITTQQFADD